MCLERWRKTGWLGRMMAKALIIKRVFDAYNFVFISERGIISSWGGGAGRAALLYDIAKLRVALLKAEMAMSKEVKREQAKEGKKLNEVVKPDKQEGEKLQESGKEKDAEGKSES